MRFATLIPLCLLSTLPLMGCPPDKETGDVEADTDADADTDSDTDADTDSDTDTDIPNEWGFSMRFPQTRGIECVGWDGVTTTEQFDDSDWLCTFEHGGVSGVVYARATPTDCERLMGYVPVFEATGQMVVDGTVSTLQGVNYDWGSNHHNDWLEFDYGGQHFMDNHSSYGWGWRKCQPMDCMQVFSQAGGTVVEDGCTCDRTLPIVCVQVQADGTWDELVDNFEICAGDSTCGEG